MRLAPPPRGEAGFALLIVLWALVLVSLLFMSLAAATRSDAQLTTNLRSAAELEAVADSAIYTTMFALLQPGGRTPPPTVRGPPGVEITIETSSLAGLVNPNTVTPELLFALLVRLGAEPGRAARVSAAIVDWRSPGRSPRPNGAKRSQYQAAGLGYGPPGAPFESLEELGQVLGMTPDLLTVLMPHLTLFSEGEPNADLAGPVVQAALRDAGITSRAGRVAHSIVRITATAQRFDFTRSVRRAVIRIGPSADRRGWRVLAWATWQG